VSLTLGMTLSRLRHRQPHSGGVAVSHKAVAEAGQGDWLLNLYATLTLD